MPWIVPVKRSSISKSTRFSAYTDIADSLYFILQKHKKTQEQSTYTDLSSIVQAHQVSNNNSNNITSNTDKTSPGTSTSINSGGNNAPLSQLVTADRIRLSTDSKEQMAHSAHLNGVAIVRTSSIGSVCDDSDQKENTDYTSINTTNNNTNNTNLHSSTTDSLPDISSSNLTKRDRDRALKQARRPTYRIVTKGIYPYYELAYGYLLDNLKSNEWKYIEEELPSIMPPHLNQKTRLKWILAHFTQLALESNDQEQQKQQQTMQQATVDSGESTDESSVIQPNSPRQSSQPGTSNDSQSAEKQKRRPWPFRSKAARKPSKEFNNPAPSSMNQTVATVLPPASKGIQTTSAPAKYANIALNNTTNNTSTSTVNRPGTASSTTGNGNVDDIRDHLQVRVDRVSIESDKTNNIGDINSGVSSVASANASSTNGVNHTTGSHLVSPVSYTGAASPSNHHIVSSNNINASPVDYPVDGEMSEENENGSEVEEQDGDSALEEELCEIGDESDNNQLVVTDSPTSMQKSLKQYSNSNNSPREHQTLGPLINNNNSSSTTAANNTSTTHQRNASFTPVFQLDSVQQQQQHTTHRPTVDDQLYEDELSEGPEESESQHYINNRNNYENNSYHRYDPYQDAGYLPPHHSNVSPEMIASLAAQRAAQTVFRLQQQQHQKEQVQRLNGVRDINPNNLRQFVVNDVRLGSPIVARGFSVYLMFALLVNFGLILIRDSSVQAFGLFLIMTNALLATLVLKGKPVTLAIHCVQEAKSAPINTTGTSSAISNEIRSLGMSSQNQNQQRSASLSNSSFVNSNNSNMSTPILSAASLNNTNVFSNSTCLTNTNTSASAKSKRPAKSVKSTVDGSDSSSKSSSIVNNSSGASLSALSPVVESKDPTLDSPSVDTNDSVSRTLSDSLSYTSAGTGAYVPPPFVMSGSDGSMELPAHLRDYASAGIRLPLGASMKQLVEGSDSASASWGPVDATSFSCRVGPNYKKNKAKSSSGPALYECIGTDLYQSDQKLDNISQLIELPLARASNGDYVDAGWSEYGAPEILVIQFQLPGYNPGMPWTNVVDGKTYCMLLYYKVTEQGKQDLLKSATPAARLFKQFCADLPSRNVENHGRFKAIPRVANGAECDLGSAMKSLLKTYNAKPFLTGPFAHGFVRGHGYLEIDIDVHRFCYMARKAAFGFLDSLKTMVIDIGFVVEGVSDDELPEQILSCTKLSYFDPKSSQSIEAKLKKAQSVAGK